MREFKLSSNLSEFLSTLYNKNKSVGFVPTMGALHKGHLNLIRKAAKENDYVVCSIFVNPLQFNNRKDFEKYPVTIYKDRELLEKEDCSILFLPKTDDLFEHNESIDFDFGKLGNTMEGKHRPGHFEGMATVVKRFLEIITPTRAYFGEKDYQQLAIIQWLVAKFDMNTEIVPCETVREESGLALSSRNTLLNTDDKRTASEIYKVLRYCRSKVNSTDPKSLANECFQLLLQNFSPEYFIIADEKSLQPINSWKETTHPRAFTAVNIGSVRLIDNLSLIL